MEPQDKAKSRAHSFRLVHGLSSPYTNLLESAGSSVSENLRLHVENLLGKKDALDLSQMGVSITYNWHEQALAESVGSLRVQVTPPNNLSASDLNRLVFILPEFFDGVFEPFRIDSYYFHRVSTMRIGIPSTRVQRNILSFRLIEGQWQAGIFHYSGNADRNVLEEKIRIALSSHITSTIICHILGQLPHSRVLSQEEVSHLNEPHQLAEA